MKGFFVLLLALVAGFSFAVTVNGNTTINSSVTQNEFFFLNGSSCILDNASGNAYCGSNTIVISQPEIIIVNQTVYPSCGTLNNTIQLTYADFGIASFTDYSCQSGELVLAPPFPNSTVEIPACNATLNTVKFEKKLYCNTDNPDDRVFKHVDFDAQQYVDIEVADCSAPVQVTDFSALNSTAQGDLCQPFYSQGYNARACPTPNPGSETSDAQIPDWVVYLLLAAVIGLLVWIAKSRGVFGARSKQEPGDPKLLFKKSKKQTEDDEVFD